MTTAEPKTSLARETPYGMRPTRWLRPLLLSLLFVTVDEQGGVALLLAVFLILVYLPRTLYAAQYRGCQTERLIRLAIYGTAIMVVFGLRFFNSLLAMERAEKLIAAVESFKAQYGQYPNHLNELVPQFLPEIPTKAKLTLMDTGFRYLGSGAQWNGYGKFSITVLMASTALCGVG